MSTFWQKNGENARECPISRMENGEPFSVCHRTPILCQWGAVLCHGTALLCQPTPFLCHGKCDMCHGIYGKIEKCYEYATYDPISVSRHKKLCQQDELLCQHGNILCHGVWVLCQSTIFLWESVMEKCDLNKTILIMGLIVGGIASLYTHQTELASAIFGGMVGYLSKDVTVNYKGADSEDGGSDSEEA